MSKRSVYSVMVMIAVIFIGCVPAPVESQEVPRMMIEELKSRLDDPEVIVLDVRSKYDYDDSNAKIKGAVREDPSRIDWAQKYPKDKALVLYCT